MQNRKSLHFYDFIFEKAKSISNEAMLVKSPGWEIITCPRPLLIMISLLAFEIQRLLVRVTSTIAVGSLYLIPMAHDISLPTMLSLPLKTFTGLFSRTKGTNILPSSPDQTFSFNRYDCAYLSHIGLISHECTCT